MQEAPESSADKQSSPTTLKEKAGAASAAVTKLLKGSIVPDVAEPEANRADDPDSCLQYTVNMLSGERQAPPKTEDGTDTEEVATSLAMVYVRIHTGDGLLPSIAQAGESSSNAPESAATEAAAPAAIAEAEASTSQVQQGDGHTSLTAAAGAAGEPAGCSGRSTAAVAAAEGVQDAVASTSAGPTEGQGTANWEEVYKDVLQSIHSSRVTEEGGSSLHVSSADHTGSMQQEERPAQAQAQDPGTGLDQQAAALSAEAIASAATESADQAYQHAAADSTTAAADAAVLPVAPSAAGQSTTDLQSGTTAASTPTPAAGTQDSSSASGLRTPVVLPPDAADLPVQAVIDELDTLLAKSDELRSSVQLRSSRQVSGQHTSTHLSRRNSLSALDKPLLSAAAAAAAEARAGSGTEWDEATRSSRRRSSSQPPAADRASPRRSSSRSSVLHSRVDAESGLTRTVLESTEAQEFTRQQSLCMITSQQSNKLNTAEQRDAATSVGGLVTPRSAQQVPAASPVGSHGGKAAASCLQDHAAAATAAAPNSGSSQGGLSERSAARRSSSSRYGGTDNGGSMEKLHALYARLMSDTASHRRSSASEGPAQGGGSSNGVQRQARRTAASFKGLAVPTASPVRSSMPYPLAVLAEASKQAEAADGRRCRSVSPDKEPQQQQRDHALSQTNLAQHQQQHGSGCALQLRHSMSLCSSCGGPVHQALTSRAGCAAVHGAPAAAAVGVLGSRETSDVLPSSHVSIAGLLSEGLVAASVAHWERQASPTPELSAVPADSPAHVVAASSRELRTSSTPGRSPQRVQSVSKSAGGWGEPGSRSSPARGRYALNTTPLRASPGSPLVQQAAAEASPRRTSGTSPRRTLNNAPVAAASEVVLSQDGVGVTQISFGQLLQETAFAAALGQLQKSTPTGSPNTSPRTRAKHPSATVSAPAAAAAVHQGAECGAGSSTLLQEGSSAAVQVLKTVPEDGLVTGPAAAAEAAPQRTTHTLVSEGVSGPTSCTVSAAAAALQELALAGARSDQQQLLSHSHSMPRSSFNTDSRHSSFADRHCLSTSSSMRASRASLSSSSSRVWRPGGTRTDPRDDYKKLQSYESARLRALQKQGLLSLGCSTRLLMAGDEVDDGQPTAQTVGSASPKSRRSTNADTLLGSANPGSPDVISGVISGGSRSSPASPASPGGYAAASQRRRNSLAAAAAAAAGVGGGATASSPVRTLSPASRRALASPAKSSPPAASAAVTAADKPAGRAGLVGPAHTAISVAALAGSSPPAPQRSASPKLRSVSPNLRRQEKPSQPQQQQQQPDVWQTLTGNPCPQSLVPMVQRLQHHKAGASPAGHKPSYASSSAQSSPERLRASGSSRTHPASRSYPSSGNSTTAQVEEAIRAAQAALREKQQQVSQVRQAISSRWAGRGRSQGLSPTGPARQHAAFEDEVCLTDSLPNSSIWGGSSCASSYTGSVAAAVAAAAVACRHAGSKDAPAAQPAALAAACPEAAEASAGANAASPWRGSQQGSPRGLMAESPVRPGSRQPGSLATVSAAVGLSTAAAAANSAGGQLAAAEEASREATTPAAGSPSQPHPAQQDASVGSAAVATESPVQAGARAAHNPQPGVQASPAVKAALAAAAAGVPGSPRTPKTYKSPVLYHSRHISNQSHKRRPLSALEELLKVSPDAADTRRGHHTRSNSAEPALASQVSGARLGFAAAAQRRSSLSNSISKRLPAAGPSTSCAARPFSNSKARPAGQQQQPVPQPQGLGRGVSSGSNIHRRSSGGGSSSGYLAEPWSAPRQRSVSGLTGEQLMELHRRRSVAEAAEAAAAAAEGDTEVAEAAEHAMPLDVLVRAYTALNKKNKNSGERTAAVAMLLERIAEGTTTLSGADSLRGPQTPRTDIAAAGHAAGADGSIAAEQSQQKLRCSPGMQLDVLGRGLVPDSPCGTGPGSTAGATSPSTIIQTLKQDSLSAWHRVSPERQAAHATLLATPKHKQASSYAADLAALAAGRSSTNLSDKPAGAHSRSDSPGKQQPGSTSPAQGEVPAAGSADHSLLHTAREGSLTGAGNARACTPLRGARLSSSSGAAADASVSPAQQQDGLPSMAQSQPGCSEAGGAPAAGAAPAPSRPMADTATGRMVLDSIGAHDMAVSAAMAWLKAGLQNPDASKPPTAPSPSAGSPTQRLRPGSPQRRPHSRPCSPFTTCFGSPNARGMVRTSDDEAEAAAAAAAAAAVDVEQQQQQAAGVDGVTFEMGSDNRLVMVVQQQGKRAPERLMVMGVRLRHGQQLPQAAPGDCADVPAAPGPHTLDLLTSGGSHTIELASASDWSGLVVGLNAMLLLLEQESPEAAARLGSLPMGQVAWSRAIACVDS